MIAVKRQRVCTPSKRPIIVSLLDILVLVVVFALPAARFRSEKAFTIIASTIDFPKYYRSVTLPTLIMRLSTSFHEQTRETVHKGRVLRILPLNQVSLPNGSGVFDMYIYFMFSVLSHIPLLDLQG